MTFHSILFETAEDSVDTKTQAPDFFVDLNLDQIVDAITAGKQEYNLRPFFYSPLSTTDAIKYRQQVMRDLENEILFHHIESFAQSMRVMREHLTQADTLHYRYQKERWFLEGVETYCDAVNRLVVDLSSVDVKSSGFLALREYITAYVQSDRFTSLVGETDKLVADLAALQYSLIIRGNSIRVCQFESAVDYSAEVEDTFEKFQQGAVKDYRVSIPDWADMNHIEAGVLDLVAKVFPDEFRRLDDFCANHVNYLDEALGAFDRQVQFYIAYLEYIAPLRRAGLKFCYPRNGNPSKEIFDYEGFDLALAHKLTYEKSPVVTNDFYLTGVERILVVSGPNQGGKTTFARAFGQLHYLASLGCLVPGREAQLYLFDNLFTHFEKEEDINNLRGKLEDDLVRIHSILEKATPDSIIVMNEIFTSTTVLDAVFLGKEVMEKICHLNSLGVFVTFLDELASLSQETVSMVSTVVPENPAQRTFKIVRRPADGLAYAQAIAEKYHLTYSDFKERLNHEGVSHVQGS
ncbi:MAG: DNA mismatch repair protein MutS [Chloroflexi bacterium]|nr:DNA mismatch repair protein MutS [Chloroflexota bacterium]